MNKQPKNIGVLLNLLSHHIKYMTLILDGRPHAAVMKKQLIQQTQEVFGDKKVYMAIIFV